MVDNRFCSFLPYLVKLNSYPLGSVFPIKNIEMYLNVDI